MNIIEITSELYLVPLDQNLPGFTSFIASWIYKGEKTIITDVGPSGTVPLLLRALESLNIKQPDVILLTHIHLDHAGGIGHISYRFPDTPVVCHASAIPHLKDPSRLWEGSLKTLGKTAEVYGRIHPVSESLLHDAAQFREYGIVPFLTPGHAPHHVSYLVDYCLFAGEAGGVCYELGNSGFEIGDNPYLRPATPPQFFQEKAVRSIDDLISVPHDILCYGHFGMTRNTPRILEIHKDQLFRWTDIITDQMKSGAGNSPSSPFIKRDFTDHCMEVLLKKDPLLAGWNRMKPEIQERERFFLRNSIIGFTGYIEKMSGLNIERREL